MALINVRNLAHFFARRSSLIARLAYGRRMYSQEGEDCLLARYFEGRLAGFYLDIGAHDPFRFSNTAYFYDRGWSGVNIDAWPGSMKAFCKARPRDINLEVGIAREPGVATLHVFNDPALNTFDPAIAESRNRHPWYIERTVDVPILPLSEVLLKHFPEGRQIDLMNIDVEGRDLDVLTSNDWIKFRPEIVLVEMVGDDLESLKSHPTSEFMKSVGYMAYAKTINTTIFKNCDTK